jgi:GDP-L-fucose synthase
MDKNSKIYIAGHRGLVGSAIHRYLESQGYSNVIGRTSEELDLRNLEYVNSFFETEKPDYVFMAAAKVGGIMANNTYRAEFIYNNLQIQNNIIETSYRQGVKKLLFLGSSCIYPKDAPQPITEDSLLTGPLEYTNEPYAIAKIAGIKMVESYNIQYGTNFLAVQPTNLYGVNDNFDLEKSHVMPALIRKMFLCKMLEAGDLANIAKNLGVQNDELTLIKTLAKYGIVREQDTVTLRVWGSGKPYREFLHVDDMAEACVFIMNNVSFTDLSDGLGEIRNTQINIGTGSDLTIGELAYMIKDIVGFGGEISFDPTKPDGTMRKLLSVEKLNKLGWRHRIELPEGLARTIEWYKKQYIDA